MGANGNAFGGQLCPQSCVHARNDEIEGHHGDMSQYLFDEGFSPCTLLRRSRPMDAVEQFRGGNRGERGRFLPMLRQHGLKAQPFPFDGDQDAGID